MKTTLADKILILVLFVASLTGIGANLYFAAAEGERQAEISVDGKRLRTVTLRPGYREEIRVGGDQHYNIIEIDGQRIRVKEADCPEQLCVRSGWIESANQQIVCLPWRVMIRVTAAGKADIDDIAR